MQVCKSESIQCMYSCMQLYKYVSMQVYKVEVGVTVLLVGLLLLAEAGTGQSDSAGN